MSFERIPRLVARLRMWLSAIPRIVRSAEFRLPVIYSLLFAASATILGTIFYWTIMSSLERQITTRIDGEIEALSEDFRTEGASELLEEVQRRNDLLAFEYLLLDKQGNRIAGTLPVLTKLGWSDVSAASGLSGERRPRTFRVRTVQLDNGMHLSVAEDLRLTEEV